MRILGIVDPKEVLRAFEKTFCDGVAGVMLFDSGRPGPTVAITACTHGNEPCGLYAIEHIHQMLTAGKSLLYGRLFLVVNNIRAAKAYLFPEKGIVCASPTARYIDLNMNRLPVDLSVNVGDAYLYEVMRAKELLPIWQQFDFALDFHSTSKPSLPMIVTGRDTFPAREVRGMDVYRVLSNIDSVQIGKPAFAYYGTGRNFERVFEIEAGKHDLVETYERAARCAEQFLRNVGVYGEVPILTQTTQYEEYRIYGYVRLQSQGYRIVRVFADFESVSSGTVLASGPGPDYVAPRDSHTLFCPSDINNVDLNEEALFLSDAVRHWSL